MSDISDITAETPEEAERHATNLELFLDLAFVFAITQIASLISYHPTGTGTPPVPGCPVLWSSPV